MFKSSHSKAILVTTVCVALAAGVSSTKASDFQSILNDHLSSGTILLAQEDNTEGSVEFDTPGDVLDDDPGTATSNTPPAPDQETSATETASEGEKPPAADAETQETAQDQSKPKTETANEGEKSTADAAEAQPTAQDQDKPKTETASEGEKSTAAAAETQPTAQNQPEPKYKTYEELMFTLDPLSEAEMNDQMKLVAEQERKDFFAKNPNATEQDFSKYENDKLEKLTRVGNAMNETLKATNENMKEMIHNTQELKKALDAPPGLAPYVPQPYVPEKKQ